MYPVMKIFSLPLSVSAAVLLIGKIALIRRFKRVVESIVSLARTVVGVPD